MGYWTWGLIVMLINVGLIAFFMISYFKEMMEYMKDQQLGYNSSNYHGYDYRGVWFLLIGILSTLVSFLIWPIMVVAWAVGLMYLYIKESDKFKRIMDIIKEEKNQA